MITLLHSPRRGARARIAFVALALAIAALPAAADDQRSAVFTDPVPASALRSKDKTKISDSEQIAKLLQASWKAFDSGDDKAGRKLAHEAVGRLEELERKERGRKQSKRASRLAMQRAQIHLNVLGDTDAAKDALIDAVADDPEDQRAAGELIQLMSRTSGSGARGWRRAGSGN